MIKDIYLDFYHRKSFANAKDAEELLRALLAEQVFAPDRWAPFEPINKTFDQGTLRAAAECLSNFEKIQQRKPYEKWTGSLLLKRTRTPKCLSMFEWSHLQHRPFNSSYFRIAADWLRTDKRLEEFLGFSNKLYAAFDGFWFASIATDQELEEKRRLKWFRPDNDHKEGGYFIEGSPGIFLEKCIPGIFWGNYFGPQYVDWFGKEKFRTLPCVTMKEMPDGGVFFTTAKTPFDWNTGEAKEVVETIREHLGSDAFFDIDALKERIRSAVASGVEVTNDLPMRLTAPCRVPPFAFK